METSQDKTYKKETNSLLYITKYEIYNQLKVNIKLPQTENKVYINDDRMI